MSSSDHRSRLDGIVDAVMDATVVPGFTRIGYAIRSRSKSWKPISSYDLTGKTAIISGVTSGLGAAAARQLRSIGADLIVIGRDGARTEQAAATLRSGTGTGSVRTVIADMGELEQVRIASDTIAAFDCSIDVLIHNAGALLADRTLTSEGREVTIATHVLGPFLMTSLLLSALERSSGRVITIASGGMYAAPLPDLAKQQTLEMSVAKYNGTRQYAIAKRAQVTLNEIWASKQPGVHFQAMHPGWADTPGVKTSLPTFGKIVKPILRSADEGADTIVWLAADEQATATNGGFWCDRAERPIHRLPSTRKSDTSEARAELWAWCRQQCGIG
jgi:dehydrogenase/reductase SDR family member 12